MTQEYDAIIYTDGGYRPTKDIGAWGCLVINPSNNRAVERAGAEHSTTNNKMELQAVIEGLKILKTPNKKILLISDSQYTINCCSKWIIGWKRKNWTKNTPGELKNIPQLKEIDQLTHFHEIDYKWVRGHSGDRGNDYVDRILNKAMDDLLNGGDGKIHGHVDRWED